MIVLFQNINKLLITLIFGLTVISAQPKLSFHLGSGFYKPSLGYLDPDSNSVIPSLCSFGKNILITWGVKYQFYPNQRIGYTRSNYSNPGKIVDYDYFRTI